MTESVTPPRAPDPPLVDPETGETPPLSPPRLDHALKLFWEEIAAEVVEDLEDPPEWWKKTFSDEPLEPSGDEVIVPWPPENHGS